MTEPTTLYGNDDTFWTSEDEDSDTDNEGVKRVDTEDAIEPDNEVRRVLNEPLAKLLEYDDPTATDAFISGPSPIPACTIIAPKPNMIRKNWVIYDDTPVDNWEQDLPDMAMTFPFQLDPFQKRAILHVHRREHTFVAAHTSSGKTVVAEYAIAVAAKRGRRAIYTSPIKALSNQKFREFKTKFDSVGIITGDVSLNPEAQCLIATTEILRAMLYRGDAILHQLDVVIFDEVHYVNDAERGVVWEEVIIMLPRDVCLVMLSATVPNYREFADWIGRTKRREVFAVATFKRPTPLKHFLWANDKEFLVMDQARFRVEAFNELYKNQREVSKSALSAQDAAGRGGGNAGSGRGRQRGGAAGSQRSKQLSASLGSTPKKPGGAKMKTDTQRLQSLIRRLEQTQQLPVVVFCFSRRKCESFPLAMGKLELLHQQDERSKVHVFIKESFSSLSESDRGLPQVVQVSALLSRGIGVHHGGLLPIVKEAVEILFAKGLVKVLFATETFAMGVNMPARSVLFASIEKHDGQRVRTLHSSEYTQMAGRAGRRGLDTYGSVYILCQSDEPPDQKAVTRMMMEKSSLLESRFRLTFGMLLQLAGHSILEIEDMLSLSFREYSRARRLPTLKRDKARVLKQLASIPPVECIYGVPSSIEHYAKLELTSRHLASSLHLSLWKHQYSIMSTSRDSADTTKSAPPFCRGRIVTAHTIPHIRCSSIAVIVGLDPPTAGDSPRFRLLVLTYSALSDLSGAPSSDTTRLLSALKDPLKRPKTNPAKVLASGTLREPEAGGHYEPGAALGYVLFSGVPLSSVGLVTSTVFTHEALDDLQKSLNSSDGAPQEAHLRLVAQELDRLNRSLKAQWVPLTFSKNLRSIEVEFIDTLLQQKDIVANVNKNLCHNCTLKDDHFELVCRRQTCDSTLAELDSLLGVESLHLYDDMKLKYRILERRQYIDARGCITLKGQVAAALTTNDDITLTEALLSNVFHDKTPNEVAALLSCFVFPDKVQEVPLGPTQGIVDGRDQIEAIHSDLEKEMKSLGILLVHEDWWRICNFGFSLVAFQWARGDSFSSIMESSEIQEGTIVRAILRLDEFIRKIRTVAKTLLSDPKLENLMEETSNRIRRDVVFAMSLYLK